MGGGGRGVFVAFLKKSNYFEKGQFHFSL